MEGGRILGEHHHSDDKPFSPREGNEIASTLRPPYRKNIAKGNSFDLMFNDM